MRQRGWGTIRRVFAMHLGFTAAHHSSPVPLILELAVAAVGGLVVLGAPRAMLQLHAMASRLGDPRAHAPRATALHR